jgi:hypothetical protein
MQADKKTFRFHVAWYSFLPQKNSNDSMITICTPYLAIGNLGKGNLFYISLGLFVGELLLIFNYKDQKDRSVM